MTVALVWPVGAGADTLYAAGCGGAPYGCGVISLDAVSGRQGAKVTVASPGGMAIVPSGRTVYVANGSGVTPINAATNTAGPAIGVGSPVSGIAVSPDGHTVMVTTADSVTPISTETNLTETPIMVGAPAGIAVTPDGRTAYALTASATLTSIDLRTDTTEAPIALNHQGTAIAITPDGTLAVIAETDGSSAQSYVQIVNLSTGQTETPVSLTTSSSCTVNLEAAVSVAPNGQTAYIIPSWACGPEVLSFDIALGTIGPPVAEAVGSFGNLAVSGDGATLFVDVLCSGIHCIAGDVAAYDTATDQPRGGFSVSNLNPDGFGPDDIVLVPDPSAGFTAAARQTRTPSRFDASASSDAGGSVTSYIWQFGDGTPPLTTTSPTVSHIYTAPGSYTVTLSTTNQGGCAATFVYTGQTASCTGSRTATTTRSVSISSPVAVATTGSATRTRTRATLHGTICAASRGVSWQFQYGTSTRYRYRTALLTLRTTDGRVTVSATVTGLAPNTRYHYRLIARTPEGSYAQPAITRGSDASFRTQATGTQRLRSRTLPAIRRTLTIPLR
ncbi:MAG: PKD domain-containing protein [Solirubrobacteraceae bacterium]